MKLIKLILFTLLTLVLFTTCVKDDKPDLKKPSGNYPKDSTGQSIFIDSLYLTRLDSLHYDWQLEQQLTIEGHHWVWFAYGNTDSTNLHMPANANQYTLQFWNAQLKGKTPTAEFTARFGTENPSKIRIESLPTESTLFMNALRNARKYTRSNEILKIFYSDKEYLLFVKKTDQQYKSIPVKFLIVSPFSLKKGEQIVINTQAEFLKYFVYDGEGYVWPYNMCTPNYELFYYDQYSDYTIDFTKYTFIVGCDVSDLQSSNTEQTLTQIGENTFYYKVRTFNTFDVGHPSRFYYGIATNKLPHNSTILFDLEIF